MRVLVIEDNLNLSDLLSERLSVRGITSDVAHLLHDATGCLRTCAYDAMLLDLGLPDGDGLEWLASLAPDRPPVLVLTARGTLEDRVRGLDKGADDYLVKPADAEEIAARLRAIARRPRMQHETELEFEKLKYDTVSRQLCIGDDIIALRTKEAEMLEVLMRRPGWVVPRERLEAAVYGALEAVTPNALEAVASRLRRRLMDATGKDMLHTVRGVGYYLGTRKS